MTISTFLVGFSPTQVFFCHSLRESLFHCNSWKLSLTMKKLLIYLHSLLNSGGISLKKNKIRKPPLMNSKVYLYGLMPCSILQTQNLKVLILSSHSGIIPTQLAFFPNKMSNTIGI